MSTQTRSSELRVLDAEAARPDLTRRRELKFVFERADVGTLRQFLTRSCKPLRYAGPVSTVRSVYFDDPASSAVRANLAGVGQREKTRVRWYDSEEPTNDFYLEVKWRRHRACGKHRALIASSVPPAELDYRDLRAQLRQIAPQPFQQRLACDSEPVILVEYAREHFALRDGGARLTLDYDLRFYPQLGCRKFRRRFPERLHGLALIEVKSAEGEEFSLPRALGPLNARAARFSKYVTGCQRLGYVNVE